MKYSSESMLRWRFLAAQLGWPGWLGMTVIVAGLSGVLILAPQLKRGNAESVSAIESLRHRLARLNDPRLGRRTRDPVGTLVSSLPPASAVSDFVADMQRRAEESAVQIDRTEYRVQPVLGQTAQRYRLSFPANSDYPHLRAWLESLLHEYPNVTLDELSMHRAVDGGEELEAHIGVSFFARDSK